MIGQTFKVLFWGFSPESGKRQFMTHEEEIFVSVDSTDSTHTLERVIDDTFWKESKTAVCFRAHEFQTETDGSRYVICKVNIVLAMGARNDIRFDSISTLKLVSGLKELDRPVCLDLWAGIALIEQYKKRYMFR